MIKKYYSIVQEKIKENIVEGSEGIEDLAHFGLYNNQLDSTVAAAALFCPDIICVKDYIFVKMFLNDPDNDEQLIKMVEKLEEAYDHRKKDIEIAINSWSVGDFFLNDHSNLPRSDEYMNYYAKILRYFWQLRVKQLFPDKNVVVELGYELMGELGLCITMYEKENEE